RAVGAGRLESHAAMETDARRAPGSLAGAGRFQYRHHDQLKHGSYSNIGSKKSTGTQLHEFLAESVALIRSEQGMEFYRQFRPSLSLSDGHGTLPEHHREWPSDIR